MHKPSKLISPISPGPILKRISFCCILFYASLSFAQNPDDKISITGVNEKYLEHLVKEKIDSVRISHGLLPLYNDSILYVASKHHAKYLYTKGSLGHYEPEDKIMETPQKRAEFYGAVNYLVGENVASTSVNVPVKSKKIKVHVNETYIQTARDFALMWVNSPPHYKNILTASYNATGVSVWVDEKTNNIYAVQKFAEILFKYDFIENKNFFNYSNFVAPKTINSFSEVSAEMHKGKHAFKIKAPKKAKTCKICDENNEKFSFGETFIEYKNRTVLLSSYSFEPIFNLLRKRKDGFAAEIVTYNHYDCGNPQYYTNPSRRNKECIFSGQVLKPVYKKKALLGFHAGTTKRKVIKEKIDAGGMKKYSIKLGDLPKDLTDYYEVNLVILQKKSVCRIKHFSSYCADTLNKFYALPFLADTISNNTKIKEEYRNITFSIPFQKGKTEYKLEDIKPLTDSLISDAFIADTMVIKAFSSVEGQSKINKRLQEQRAAHIANAIANNQKEKLAVVITQEENWTLFEKQIKENADLKFLKELPREKLKTKLLDTALQRKIEKYLSKQRVAKIRLHAKEIIDSNNIERYVNKKLKKQRSLIAKYMGEEKKIVQLSQCIDTMKYLMEISYGFIKSGKLKTSLFEQFDISKDKYYNVYNLQKLKYWLQLHTMKEDSVQWIRKTYDELVSLYNNDEKSFFIVYNMLNIIQQYSKEININIEATKQDGFITELKSYAKSPQQDTLAMKIALNFWFSVCQLPEHEQPKDNLPVYKKSLQNIYEYFKGKELPARDLNKLASFYQLHNRADWAIEILFPDYKLKKDNPQGLKMLAKLFYENYEESGNKKYYDFLKEIAERMDKESWCSMFVGPCNISFQAFDYEEFRNFYCRQCADYMNYVKDPKKK